MSWTDEETTALVDLWSSASSAQIARRLHKTRSAVSAKAHRLCADGILHRGQAKQFTVPPRPKRTRPKAAAKPPPSVPIDEPLDMAPCSLLELADTMCRWPLAGMHETATMFCGATTMKAARYCAFHSRMAARRDASQ